MRAILVSVVLALVLLSWWLGESRQGYRLGEPSPRTYVAIMNTNYLDEESTELLRRHAADNIVAVMTKDSHTEVRIRDRLEQLKRRNGIERFSVTLREMLSAMTPARRARMLHLAQELGLSILVEKNWGKDIQKSLWDGIMRLPIPRPEQNAVFQILEEIFQEPVKIDDEATEKLKRESSSKVEPVIRVLYPGGCDRWTWRSGHTPETQSARGTRIPERGPALSKPFVHPPGSFFMEPLAVTVRHEERDLDFAP